MKELRSIKSRYEFQLENRQIILIVSGLLLVLMLSFLMGALFGLNLDRMSDEPQVAATAAPPPAAAPAGVVPAPAPTVETEPITPMAEPFLGGVSSREDLIRQLEGEKVPAQADAETPAPIPTAPEAEPEPGPAPTMETVPSAPVLASPAPKPAAKDPAPAKVTTTAQSLDEMTIARAAGKPAPAPAPAPAAKPAPAPAPKPVSSGSYTIQLASVPSRAEAEAMVNELRQKRYDAYLLQVSLPGKGTFYRVRVGHYKDLEQAKKALIIIQSREGKYFDAWVTQ